MKVVCYGPWRAASLLWQPSPGSVYPALAQLEDENLIALQDTVGTRRAYGLTEDGRSYVAEHTEELNAPWSDLAGAASAAHAGCIPA